MNNAIFFKSFLFVLFAAAPALAQTDVGLSLYGAFTGTTNSSGETVSPANAAGGIVELRHLSNPLVGYEATYSLNRANQEYTYQQIACPVATSPTCLPTSTTAISADAHEVTVDWVPHVKVANFRPFGVLGVGVLVNVPVGGQSNTQTSTKAVYVYGAGLDWGVLPHLGLRFQYRGNLYEAPDVSRLYTSVSAFTHTAEPMIGAYFHF
jgi:opacity protein-like surface antigen